MNDLKFAVRRLLKSPGFTAVVVLTLALGIGANTTVFSWFRSTLVDAIPGAREQHRLVVLAPQHISGGITDTMSLPDIQTLREATNVFRGIAGSQIDAFPVRIDREIEWIWGQPVQADFFDVVGVRAALGRTFQPGEDLPGATEPVAVISHRLWQRRFGGDPLVLGRTIEVNERPTAIVGVAAAGFHGTMGGLGLDLWVPLSVHLSAEALRGRAEARGSRWLHTVARLRPGVSLERARVVAAGIAKRLADEFPESGRDTSFVVLPVWKAPWGGQELFLPLLQVLGMVALLLLALVIANIANLSLARAQGRDPEVAVQLALGAPRRRILGQFLTESLVLAALGGVGGALLAAGGTNLLLRLLPPTYLPVQYRLEVDGVSLAVTCAVALLTGLLFGMVPAWRATRLNLNDTLKSAARSNPGGFSRHWLRRGLVIGEIALACTLLLGMGLCVRSFIRAKAIDIGLNPHNLALVGYRLNPNAGDRAWVNGLFRRLREEAGHLPGVQSAALADWLPLGFEDGSGGSVGIPGYTPQLGESMASRVGLVTPGFFETLEIPVLAGRTFREGDSQGPTRLAVVNQAFVDRYFPGREPLGLDFRIWGSDARIIGVVKTGKYLALNEAPFPYVYLDSETSDTRDLTLVVRTQGDPAMATGAIEKLSRLLDARLTPFATTTYETYMAASLTIPRMAAVLLTTLGVIALGLAGLGTYAVVAQSAQQRRQEIGVRIALGATRGNILRLILRQGLGLAGIGVGLGVLAGVGVARSLASLLVGVSATDLLAWLGPPVLLIAITVAACWLPARRAARVDPMVALRSE